ncbi:hypothetical protein CTheo_7798 [Ceratobasidium theobromae]|uniref:Uncharacterized protein n=1 Tax=Ceratobasidium theobromae TaxID=1582974 RepID=A0A5N5QAP9_9AGAM|nr:hypothetical protein CTheo_7798 [Ceratobasidium theobromae]
MGGNTSRLLAVRPPETASNEPQSMRPLSTFLILIYSTRSKGGSWDLDMKHYARNLHGEVVTMVEAGLESQAGVTGVPTRPEKPA